MEKVRRHFSISTEVDEAIQELSEKNKVNRSFIVERAMRYYLENEGRQSMQVYRVLNNRIVANRDELRQLRFATNSINKDAQVLVECRNQHHAISNAGEFISTERKIGDEVKEANEIAQKRIARRSQK